MAGLRKNGVTCYLSCDGVCGFHKLTGKPISGGRPGEPNTQTCMGCCPFATEVEVEC